LKPKPVKAQPKSDPLAAKSKSQAAAVSGSQKRLGHQKFEDIPLKQATGERTPGTTEAHYSLTSELVVDDLLK
jgi:hypothetical protein